MQILRFELILIPEVIEYRLFAVLFPNLYCLRNDDVEVWSLHRDRTQNTTATDTILFVAVSGPSTVTKLLEDPTHNLKLMNGHFLEERVLGLHFYKTQRTFYERFEVKGWAIMMLAKL